MIVPIRLSLLLTRSPHYTFHPPLSSSQQSHVVHNRHPHPRLHSPSPTRPPLQSSHVYRIPTVQSLHLPRRLRQFEHIGSEVSGGIDRVFCVSESGESERCGEACAEEFERDLKREREWWCVLWWRRAIRWDRVCLSCFFGEAVPFCSRSFLLLLTRFIMVGILIVGDTFVQESVYQCSTNGYRNIATKLYYWVQVQILSVNFCCIYGFSNFTS